ncbi:hypothetical protein HK096_007986, partial [Nowakowskiella sp. JEL0078]
MLDRLLSASEAKDRVSVNSPVSLYSTTNASRISQQQSGFGVPTPLIGKFQTALKTREAVRGRKEQYGRVLKDAETVLQELGIENTIDDSVEEIRTWISTKILEPLVEKIARVDSFFKDNQLKHLDCKSTSLSKISTHLQQSQQPQPLGNSIFGIAPMATATSSNIFGTKSTTGLLGGGSNFTKTTTSNSDGIPQTLLELIQKYSNLKQVEERMKIENYLTIPEFDCRGYIIDRIETLAKGGFLTQYNWNSGGKWEGNEWNSALYPTDAQ